MLMFLKIEVYKDLVDGLMFYCFIFKNILN